ncbi:peptidase domain-containing ABC transporter [Stenotrophomonas sp. TWI1183]|uniref:peptidase domain-containing ABC transporter n=1 Tax=Stenotrophomonas sp. TWI1183 TaxID=3136799 RepID=UPI003209D3C2
MSTSSFLAWISARRLPMVHQSEAAECGLACLAMVANFHGHDLDLSSLRRRFDTSLKGMHLASLMQIADSLGLESRPIKVDLEDVAAARLPCILHWDMTHFVVLKRVTARGLEIHDPARGARQLTLAEAGRHFTGVLLELSPRAGFTPIRESRSISLRRLAGDMPGLPGSIVQLLGLALAIEVLALTLPFQAQWVIDHVILSTDRSLLAVMTIGFALVLLISAALQLVRAWIISWLGAALNTEWIANLFSHLLRLPLAFFQKRHMGDVLSRFSSVHAIQNTLTGSFIEAVLDGVMGLLALVIIWLYSAQLTLLVGATVTLYVATRWALYRRLWHLTEEQLVYWANQQSELMESIRGIQAIKLGNKQALRRARLASATMEANKRAMQVQRHTLGFGVMGNTFFGLQRVLIIALGAHMVMLGEFSAGMLIAFVAYADQFSQKTGGLVDKIVEFRMLKLHAERIADIALAEQEQHVQSTHSGQAPSPRIRLRNLGFRYSPSDPWVFRNVSVEFNEGDSVAIVGPSGYGKSTLARLMVGLLEPSEGTVEVDGVDIRSFGLARYRDLLGVVMQDDALFAGTIADNIAFFDDAASMDAIIEAATTADIHRDIAALPMGYESLVGDMGAALSGGQQQRLLLARAFYKKPLILILDEATSHLDARTEQVINHHVAGLAATRIVFAHRQETIASANRVVDLTAFAHLEGRDASPLQSAAP